MGITYMYISVIRLYSGVGDGRFSLGCGAWKLCCIYVRFTLVFGFICHMYYRFSGLDLP